MAKPLAKYKARRYFEFMNTILKIPRLESNAYKLSCWAGIALLGILSSLANLGKSRYLHYGAPLLA